ncbi:serine/threonine protein kinase [Penicillium atrosanguineum]|nr:serine/threonine protein kinase [Penicillium atrosanguineum]
MLETAGILYDVNMEDDDENDAGIYLDGIFWMLYPTAYIKESNTIQWHLVRKFAGKEQNRAISPDKVSGPSWIRIRDFETLSSATAVLGYCSEVVIQLGTQGQREQYERYRFSSTKIEDPPPDISTGTVSLGFSALGFVTGQFAAAFKPRKALRDAHTSERDMSYTEVLDRTEVEPVILFETEEGNERAWMVPQLCVILDLFNFWALRKGLENIRYAKPGANGGAEARAILADPEYANRVVIPKILHTESDILIGDVVKQIYGRMQKRMASNAESDEGAKGAAKLGRAGIVGWDLLELTDLSWTITRRREVRPARKTLTDMKPSWMSLTKVVPIFFGQFMGELITPARPSEVCRHWYPIPGGLKNNYLAASVRCISALANHYGHNRCWFLPENLRWLYKDEFLFHPCVNCIADPTICVKRPQALEPATNNGAVVFASQRKDGNFLDMRRKRRISSTGVVE